MTVKQLDVFDEAIFKLCQTYTNLINSSQDQFEKFGKPSVNLEIIYMIKNCTFEFVDVNNTGKIQKTHFYLFLYLIQYFIKA